jgi:hypothetical protein
MNPPTARIKLFFRLLSLVLGLLQAWANRFYIDPDGVNYLDISRAYLNHDWNNALNAYWSPLYSWLLASLQWAFRAPPYWESTLLHGLNFLIFVCSLAAFEFFFTRLLSLARQLLPDLALGQLGPEWASWVLGYAAFLTCTLRLIGLRNDTPDMALAACVFLATGILVDLAHENSGAPEHLGLGSILAVAYFAKAVMLPMSLVYVGSAAVARRGLKRPDARALLTLASFLLMSLPFAIALSKVKGHFTFGETGRVAYIDEVSGARALGVTRGPRKLYDEPPVYLYATPYVSTYPKWYDPSYWYEGARIRFSLRDQLRTLGRSLSNYFQIFSTEKHWLAGLLLCCFLSVELGGNALANISKIFPLWGIPLTALVLYSFVRVEPRYVAVWLTIMLLAFFAAPQWPKAAGALGRIGVAVALALASISGLALLKGALADVASSLHPAKHVQWQVAQGLRQLGLSPGDQVAFLGHTTVADYWAHLSGLRVTADIPLEAMPAYQLASRDTRTQIASRLSAEGIKALVTLTRPPDQDWIQIGDTGYYVKFLSPNPGQGLGAAPAPAT